MGPNVQLFTPSHPLEAGPRRAKWEGAKPITIGDNTMVGAGTVVTRDSSTNALVMGNPARVIRELGDSEQAVLRMGGRS
jgi:maltose O-acetyltransferase